MSIENSSFYSLNGRVALITGGAGGIGKAIGEGFLQAGAKVVFADIDLNAAEATCRELGDNATACYLDLGDVASCLACVKSVIDNQGGIDVLVNNGGICQEKSISEVTQEFYDRMFNINVRGTFFCSQAAVTQMLEQQHGRIINISSIAAKTGGTADHLVYAATKAAVTTMTKTFARSLAPYGTVNSILPGPTDTKLFRGWASDEQAATLLTKIPMERLGQSEDCVGAVLFLASEAASYITGATVDINGGMLMD